MNIIEMEIKGKLMETNMVDSYTSNLHICKNINVNIVVVMNYNDSFFFWEYTFFFIATMGSINLVEYLYGFLIKK